MFETTVIRVDELSSDSSIGGEFFFFFFFFFFRFFLPGKVFFRLNLSFHGLTFDSVQIQFISSLKRKANSTIEQRKCEDQKKRDLHLVVKIAIFSNL